MVSARRMTSVMPGESYVHDFDRSCQLREDIHIRSQAAQSFSRDLKVRILSKWSNGFGGVRTRLLEDMALESVVVFLENHLSQSAADILEWNV